MRRKVSPNTLRDFKAYHRWYRLGSRLFGDIASMPPSARDGVSALQAFAAIESTGKRVPCRHPEILRHVLAGKAQLNWQIEQWREGMRDGLFFAFEFKEAYPWLPDWVWSALGEDRAEDFAWAMTGEQRDFLLSGVK